MAGPPIIDVHAHWLSARGFPELALAGAVLPNVLRVLLGTDYPAVPISPHEHIDIVRSLGPGKIAEERSLAATPRNFSSSTSRRPDPGRTEATS